MTASVYGPADEDSGYNVFPPIDLDSMAQFSGYSDSSLMTGAEQPANARISSTQPSGPQVSTAKTKPGKRLSNPLGDFTSYNYQISLYMVTPDAYDAFVQSGRRNIASLNQAIQNQTGISSSLLGTGSGGAFLVAQSGGINNSAIPRAPGFEVDYGIDNLVIESVMSKNTGTATNTTKFNFNITEPYGFSFMTKLSAATNSLSQYTKGTTLPPNPTRQFFILGIRFVGYGASGNTTPTDPNSAKSILGQLTKLGGLNTNASDFSNQGFEKYFDITITEMKFRIDGRITTYNIEAHPIAVQSAMTIKRGMITANTEVTGETVQEILDALCDSLNAIQTNDTSSTPPTRQFNNVYNVAFTDPYAQEHIAKALILTPEDLDKSKFPGSKAANTTESTGALEVKTQPEPKKRTIKFKHDTPILQAISQVIAQSTYLRDALTVVYDNALEPDPKKKSETLNKPEPKRELSWYNCSADVSLARWDEVLGDWAFDINYNIQSFLTPVIDSAYAKTTSAGYYGPHKRYKYWYTGENSEILKYEQTNNVGYLIATAGISDPSTSDGAGNATEGQQIPVTPNKRTSQPRIGKLGIGMEAQNNYLTSLYDPSSYANATIQILGDPDYLMSESYSSVAQVYDRFYGTDGYTINANGGQVFIEIDFKEATDYSLTSTSVMAANSDRGITGQPGTLSINDSIRFWDYPENIAKVVQGVSYQVINVTSTFSNGKFIQNLETVVNTFGSTSALTGGPGNREDAKSGMTNTGPATTSTGASTGSAGTKPDPKLPQPIIQQDSSLAAERAAAIQAERDFAANQPDA